MRKRVHNRIPHVLRDGELFIIDPDLMIEFQLLIGFVVRVKTAIWLAPCIGHCNIIGRTFKSVLLQVEGDGRWASAIENRFLEFK